MVSTPTHDSLLPLPKNRCSSSSGCSRRCLHGLHRRFLSTEVGNENCHGKMEILTYEVKSLLEKESFRSFDFWEGYKLYCFARYSDCESSKKLFVASKMDRVCCQLQRKEKIQWHSISDERVRKVWAMMEEYAAVNHGQDWRNLRDLMEEFDDVKNLSKSDKGCLLLQLVEDDDNGTEELYRESQRIQIQGTNIFEEIRERLNCVSSNLDRLIESSETSPKDYSKRKRKCLSTRDSSQKRSTKMK